MIGDLIGTFGNTTSAVNQKIIQNSREMRQVPDFVSHTRKFDMSPMTVQVKETFRCPMFKYTIAI